MENTIEKGTGENRLGVMPVGKLLTVMSVPAVFSMLIQALYNIVDSIFVSHYSEKALTAVSLAFPMQLLMISFAVGTSIGICSVISRRLGEKREDEANLTAETGYSLELIFMVMFVLIGAFLSKPFVSIYTKDPKLSEMTVSYIRICLMLSFGNFVNIFCEKSLQATGDTIHPMMIQASGAIFNIIFDPILIFGYFGFPQLGVVGAAIATVSGQFFAMFLGLFFLKRNKYLKIRLLRPRMGKKEAKDILTVGIPSIIMQGIGTIMTSAMNAILIVYDVLAATVFGVYFKLQSFVFMPILGLNAGLLPILGYNYGAKNKPRMMKALKLAAIFAVIFMSLCSFVFIMFPDALLGLFNASDSMKKIGEVALRTIAMMFPISAVCITLTALFQAMGDGIYSMIISIIRQLLLLIPSAWILGKLFGLDAIWYSFLIAEVVALALSLVFLRKELKKLNF